MKSILILLTLITVCTSTYAATTPVTQKQAKSMKLTTTNKPVRKTVHEKECVVMIDKKTRKTYTVCPN